MLTDDLIGHLRAEAELYKELIAVLQSETASIVGRDYKALYEIVGRKEHLVMRANAMAGSRVRLMGDAAASLGVRPDEAGLAALIERAGAGGAALDEALKALVTLASTVKEINALNRTAMESSLENVRKTLGFLGNFLQPSVYKSGGAFEEFAVKGAHLSKGA